MFERVRRYVLPFVLGASLIWGIEKIRHTDVKHEESPFQEFIRIDDLRTEYTDVPPLSGRGRPYMVIRLFYTAEDKDGIDRTTISVNGVTVSEVDMGYLDRSGVHTNATIPIMDEIPAGEVINLGIQIIDKKGEIRSIERPVEITGPDKS